MRSIAALIAMLAASPALAQVQQFYGSDGSYRGTAMQSGPNAKQFYDASGAHAGTALRAGNNVMLYGSDGSYAGMATNSGGLLNND